MTAMQQMVDSIPSEFVRWMEVPQHPNVFVLGPFARQVTFASQQTRAFNLIWALFRLKRLAAGNRMAVVGAGLAGLTATMAGLAKGCAVDLFEQASQPCPIQRGNDIRFIHPNILRWPDEGSEAAYTDFPFLNWTAANVRGVIKQIDLQWRRRGASELLRRFFNYKVTRVFVSPSKSGPQRPWLAANRVVDGSAAGDETSGGVTPGYMEFSYDCVVLTVGFGEEKSMLGVPFLSYWENDSLHQETGRGRRSILVSGCGDGGLIDALRLRLRNFDHADFVRRFLSAARSPELIASLRQVESDLRRHARVPDISLRFQAAYDAVAVPLEVQRYFQAEKRTDASVTLNSPAPGPLSFGSSLLNRYATYLAMRYADLHYLSGRVLAERSVNGQYQVTLQRDDVNLSETRSFDLLIVRHGPDSVIRHLIPESAINELGLWWAENEDITTKPYWRAEPPDSPHQFFQFATETAPPAKDVLDLALATFEPAYREFNQGQEVQSLTVGERDGKAGFIVTLKPGAAQRQSTFYAGVLVQFVVTPAREDASPVPRRVSAGAGIYNYDAARRLDHFDASVSETSTGRDAAAGRRARTPLGTGTLGCFVTDEAGAIYLLSTAFVLAPANASEQGDQIFLEGQSPDTGHTPIARLERTIAATATPEGLYTLIDAATARLEADVRPEYDWPALTLISGLKPGVARPADRVLKIGRTSGVTTGVVEIVSTSVRISTSAAAFVYDDCILIRGEPGHEFSLPGDGGAVIVRTDGAVVGLLVAAQPGGDVGVACSFERVLQNLNLKVWAKQNRAQAAPARRSRKRVPSGRRKA
jgi:hypothetical protein